MTPLIDARNLTKRFGDTVALSDVDLRIHAGECVGLLGPNGAGKTTFLSLVEGLRAPTTGTVSLFGRNPRERAARLALGSTPQATALPEGLRVKEVLDFVAAHYPAPAARDSVVAEFGLESFLDKQCGSLSGGQQRRVAVALAFVGNPELVLLDEPTTGLDVDARHALWTAVRARHASGCAVVVTSHHLEEIEQLAERVVVIDEGSVRADDSLHAIVESVARRRVSLSGVSEEQALRIAPDAVVSADGRDGRIDVFLSDSDSFVRALVREGVEFSGLTVRGATLEEAFLTITKGTA